MLEVFKFTHIWRHYPFAYLITLLGVSIPLFLTDIPPLVDYPNHLARMHILINSASTPLLAEKYTIQYGIIPNLGMDIIVPLLSFIVPLEMAGRLFIILIFVTTILGCAILNRVLFGHWSIWPLFASLFLYNGLLLTGFMNFSLGLGLFLCAFALWIYLRNKNQWIRLMASSIAALLLFFCHLTAVAFYGLVATAYELSLYIQANPIKKRRAISTTNLLILFGQFVFPCVLYFLFSEPSYTKFNYSYSWGKLRGPFLPFLNYSLVLDIMTTFVVAIFLIAGFLSRSLRIAPSMRLGLFLMILGFLLLPGRFMDAAWVDSRFPVATAFLLIACTTFRVPRFSLGIPLVICIASLITLRTAVVGVNWLKHNDDLSEFRAAIHHVDEGSSLIAAWPSDEWKSWWLEDSPHRFVLIDWPLYAHFPSLAVIEKSVFYPYLFTHPAQQPIRPTKKYEALDRWVSFPPSLETLISIYNNTRKSNYPKWSNNFQYLLVLYANHKSRSMNPAQAILTPLFKGNFIELYRIK